MLIFPIMGGEDFIELPTLSNSGCVNVINREASQAMPADACKSGLEAFETECAPTRDSSNENKKAHMPTDIEKDAVNDTRNEPVDFEMTEAPAVVNAVTSISSVNTENGSLAVESEIILSNHMKNGTLISSQEIDNDSISGVKRPRLTVDEHQPSVRVIFNSLTRGSKRKLEEVLQQWSQWHAQKCSSSNDTNTVIESGEETYFPALHVGLDKPSQVTFWVDNQTKIQSNKEFIPLDGISVPLYDRAYSLALTSGDGSSNLNGGVEKLDASRCFNCGSYSHPLKDCPKPRDNAAVNSARKQHNSKRNQNANSRNSARYYQSSRGGKYDGLTPGVLNPETRKLLGLGELDPPPWLNRMRELGYPPGYLDPDEEEEQPSGITIFGDEPNKEEGEIHSASSIKPTRKKSVGFPGINAPIPRKANALLWTASSSSPSLSRDHSHNLSRVNYQPRWSANLDNERPPGCDPLTSPSLANHFRRYSDYDRESSHMGHSPLASSSAQSPILGRLLSDRGGRSPLAQDEYPNYGRYGTYPHSYPR